MRGNCYEGKTHRGEGRVRFTSHKKQIKGRRKTNGTGNKGVRNEGKKRKDTQTEDNGEGEWGKVRIREMERMKTDKERRQKKGEALTDISRTDRRTSDCIQRSRNKTRIHRRKLEMN